MLLLILFLSQRTRITLKSTAPPGRKLEILNSHLVFYHIVPISFHYRDDRIPDKSGSLTFDLRDQKN